MTMPEEVQLALLHWRPLTALINMLLPNKCLKFKSVNSLCNGNGTLVSEVPNIVRPVLDVVDAHG